MRRLSARIESLPPYLFAEIERKVAAKRAAGVDIISLGIGDPDTPTPTHIIAALVEAARTRPRTSTRRTRVRVSSARRWPATTDGVSASPSIPNARSWPPSAPRRASPTSASRLLDPGDVCLVPDPGYPVYVTGPLLADGRVVRLPLQPGLGFQPDLEAIEPAALAQAKMVFASYPNNPTGAVIEDDFFARLVAFAREHDIVVVHDNAYADITYDGYVAPSFLETPGAKDVGVEFFSLSKTYNMTGWRVGAVVGNPDLIEAFWRLKTNIDSGMFGAVQRASAAALEGPQDGVADLRAIYQRRRDLLVARCAHRPRGVAAQGHHLPVGPGPRGAHLGELHGADPRSRPT